MIRDEVLGGGEGEPDLGEESTPEARQPVFLQLGDGRPEERGRRRCPQSWRPSPWRISLYSSSYQIEVENIKLPSHFC